jgi:two-component system, chemotaxis family, chemotaxis protein CheY
MEKRAIIVDDEPATCELIEKVLTSAGIESLAVTNSKEAPEILRHGRFAVAFLDYHMDFPDGRVLARQMRASGSNRGTPIVMISDDQRPGAVSEGFEAGASFFLYKPVDKDRLQKLVRATQATIESGMRRTRRVELKSKVSIRFRGQEIEGQTINVSMEGMLIRTPKIVPIGSSVEVCLQMSRTETIAGVGSVVRMHGREEMGIHLGRLTLEESQRLQEHLLPLIAM